MPRNKNDNENKIANEPQFYISLGEKNKLLSIKEGRITYTKIGKSYNFQDPEEIVRASFYVKLIEKYKYPENRIDLEVEVPRRKPSDFADIVIYEDDARKQPYIVAECKKEGISQSEINQAIEQVFGNANSLRAKFAIMVAGSVEIAFDVAGFDPQEREKNIISDIPIRYGKVVKFKFKKGDPEWDLKPANLYELQSRLQQCHDIIWQGGKRNPAEAFDEMSKLMFCKDKDERVLTPIGDFYNFQIGTHESAKEVADRIRDIYKKAQSADPLVFESPVRLEDEIIYSVVEKLQGVSLSKTELDAKGRAFETFLGKVFRGEMGQYFTPRTIVQFMVEMLEPNFEDVVIDPACGSGGFLLYALDKIRQYAEAKFGKEEGRVIWKDRFALYQLYGIEINSLLARVAMMNMIIHEDGHSNIENSDALDNPSKFHPRRDIRLGKYSLLLTNPPFGAVVRGQEHNYLSNYELGSKTKHRKLQKTEILFLERCLNFLAPNGRMGIVIPDGILTNSTLQYVRDYLQQKAKILAVVSLPSHAFTNVGTGVRASLLFIQKLKKGESIKTDHRIFMAIAEHIGYDTIGREDINELPEILKEYKQFQEESSTRGKFSFAVLCKDLEDRFDPFYYKDEFRILFQRLKKSKYPVRELGNYIEEIRYGASLKNIYVKDGIPLLRIINLKPNHIDLSDVVKLPKEKEKDIGKCFVHEGDILISRSGTIGVTAVVSKEADGSAFGSFMIKFKVKKQLNPHYTTFILNSDLVQPQILRSRIGAIQKNITIPAIKALKIPVPPPKIQKEIVNKFITSQKKANELKQKAQEVIESTKSEIIKSLIP